MKKEHVIFMITLLVACLFVVNAQTNVIDLKDWQKVEIVSPLESNGAIPVNIQDQHSRTFDAFFTQAISNTTLNQTTSLDDYNMILTAGHGFVVGDYLGMFDTVSTRIFFGEILDVSINNITLDTPINFNYPTANTTVRRLTRELDVDGSSTRQTFVITNPVDIELDITRIMFQMITSSAPDFGKFGDITGGLERGVVLRVNNGINVNYFNVKDNGELVNLMYDVNFYDPSNPGQGVFGLGGRLTYAGQEKHGVTIRLAQGDTLEVIIQDDLTSLITYRMIATGHEVVD